MTRPRRVFPAALTGADGLVLRIGSHVVSDDGTDGEVVGYVEGRGVDVLTDDGVVPRQPGQLRRSQREATEEASTFGWFVEDERDLRTSLLVPVGNRDVQLVRPKTLPLASAYSVPEKELVDVRAWSRAVLDVLDQMDPDEARRVLRDEVRVPMLTRSLVEATLPSRIERLVLIDSDQKPDHFQDTSGFSEIIRRWLPAVGDLLEREIGEVATHTIEHAPHEFDSVLHSLSGQLVDLVGDVDAVVVQIAGGTPAMTYGTIVAANLQLPHLERRSVQVPRPGPLIETVLPGISLVT